MGTVNFGIELKRLGSSLQDVVLDNGESAPGGKSLNMQPGISGLMDDLITFQSAVETGVRASITPMAEAMKQALVRSIETNVYDKYEPKDYPRRRDYPEFGPSLIDMDTNVEISVTDDGFVFQYSPHGEHSGKMRDTIGKNPKKWTEADAPIKPYPVHGDKLIERIETGQGYDWDYANARPFWNAFSNEITGARSPAYAAFVEAMAQSGITIEPDSTEIVQDPEDVHNW
nr:MAG TPA: hypothetical protein [Bacteriophage sp.]